MTDLRILVVDDEEPMRRYVARVVEHLNYGLCGFAATGEEALRAVAELKPDMVLMDIGLGGEMDGIATADRLRQSSDIPVLYMTGLDAPSIVDRAKLTEPFGYLLKPFRVRELRVAVEMALYKRKMEQRLKAELQRLHEAEEALGAANETLERRVAERTAQVTDGLRRLERELFERKRLEKEVLAISNREQSRIGQDLHDSVIQRLVGVTILNQVLESNLAALPSAPGPLPPVAQAAQITQLINETIEEIRGLARGLCPVALEDGGLLAVLTDLSVTTSRMFRVSCSFTHDQSYNPDNIETATHLFRIAQESVNNAIKHGGANNILIDLRTQDGSAMLTIKDDGKGLPGTNKPRGGMGQRIMKYRADLIRGALEIGDNPDGRGTQVSCRIPLREPTQESFL